MIRIKKQGTLTYNLAYLAFLRFTVKLLGELNLFINKLDEKIQRYNLFSLY